ncbi:MAG: flagellar basal body-associated FliL family protein [Fusobacteria bacterium]|jgi:flagellar basal body-associated protein FliL|nr:flagellar basal body-associated FliL family protein [Fusobacteriota bacterium]
MADGEKNGMPFVTKALIIAILSVVVVVVSAGTAAYIAKNVKVDGNNTEQKETKDNSKKESNELGVIVPFGEYTVNLNEKDPRYLVIEIHFETEVDKKSKTKGGAEIESKMIIIQDRVLKVLKNKSIKDLNEDSDLTKLKLEILEAVNNILVETKIKDVYIVKWLIQ